MGILAGLTLLLAAISYGVLARSVSQRTQRDRSPFALGAGRRDILGLILGRETKLTLIGLGIGITVAMALTRLMRSLLFGVNSMDHFTFVSVALLLTFVAMLASYIPARRAMRVDPMIALRYE